MPRLKKKFHTEQPVEKSTQSVFKEVRLIIKCWSSLYLGAEGLDILYSIWGVGEMEPRLWQLSVTVNGSSGMALLRSPQLWNSRTCGGVSCTNICVACKLQSCLWQRCSHGWKLRIHSRCSSYCASTWWWTRAWNNIHCQDITVNQKTTEWSDIVFINCERCILVSQ